MSRNIYRNFVQLLKKWPVDEEKKGRNLGEYLRTQFAENFPRGESTPVTDFSKCEKIYQSLDRIARNNHSDKYPRTLESTAMGLSPEQAGKIVSNEMLKELNK